MADIETPTWRNKQKIGNIMSRLNKHAEGEIEMTSTQISAAKLYLDKTLPSLASTQISGDPDGAPINIVGKIERVIIDAATSNHPTDSDA